jgi:hypothetical protein
VTTETYPLLRVTGSQVRVVDQVCLRLPKIGQVRLSAETPLPEDCEIARVHLARATGDWRARVFVFDNPPEENVHGSESSKT